MIERDNAMSWRDGPEATEAKASDRSPVDDAMHDLAKRIGEVSENLDQQASQLGVVASLLRTLAEQVEL